MTFNTNKWNFPPAPPAVPEKQTGPGVAAATAPSPPKGKAGKGCLGCLGVLVICMLIGWIADMAGCNSPPKMSDAFKAGEYLGQIEGHMAYNGGRSHASDDELDGVARRVTANMTFNAPDGRNDWILGYKVGYSLGWDRAKEK